MEITYSRYYLAFAETGRDQKTETSFFKELMSDLPADKFVFTAELAQKIGPPICHTDREYYGIWYTIYKIILASMGLYKPSTSPVAGESILPYPGMINRGLTQA